MKADIDRVMEDKLPGIRSRVAGTGCRLELRGDFAYSLRIEQPDGSSAQAEGVWRLDGITLVLEPKRGRSWNARVREDRILLAETYPLRRSR